MAEATSVATATSSSSVPPRPPACRSSLHRIRNARSKWEAHRRRQPARVEERDDDDGGKASATATVFAAPSAATAPVTVTVAAASSSDSTSAPKTRDILRAKTRVGAKSDNNNRASSASKVASTFANIDLTSWISSAPHSGENENIFGSASTVASRSAFGCGKNVGFGFVNTANPALTGVKVKGENAQGENKPASSSSDGGYSPMAAPKLVDFAPKEGKDKAPTTFSSSASGVSESPTSTVAPTPFSTKETTLKPNTSVASSEVGSSFIFAGGAGVGDQNMFGSGGVFGGSASSGNANAFGSGTENEKVKPSSGASAFGGGSYPPVSAAAPNLFSSKVTATAPKANTSTVASAETESPCGLSVTNSKGGGDDGAKSIFGSGSAFGGKASFGNADAFDSGTEKEKVKPSSGASAFSGGSYPPVSAAAPNPFSSKVTATAPKANTPDVASAETESPFDLSATTSKGRDGNGAKSIFGSGSAFDGKASFGNANAFGSGTEKETVKLSSGASAFGGGSYPPVSAAAPNLFSSKVIESAPKANTPNVASAEIKSPFDLSATNSKGGGGDGAKSIFGSGSAFGGSASFRNANAFGSDSGTSGFSFGNSANPAPLGGFSSNPTNASPFGAKSSGVSVLGGFGKPDYAASSTNAFVSTGKQTAQNSIDTNRNVGSNTDYKSKLTEFYKEHNPSKLSSVDANLAKYEGREDELFRKLYQKYGLSPEGKKEENPFAEPGGTGPRVFLDLSLGGKAVGRILVQLYANKAPVASENFRALCTGSTAEENGAERVLQKTFAKSIFHRVVPGMCLQGGDITKSDGTGGRSIYPPNSTKYGTDAWGKFRDETPFLRHSKRGLLSMANAGANQNSSQFFITLRKLPYLDGKHVVFGEVVEPGDEEENEQQAGEGMKVLDHIMELVGVNPKTHRPNEECRVVIEACGEV